jgi:hypothetical protein
MERKKSSCELRFCGIVVRKSNARRAEGINSQMRERGSPYCRSLQMYIFMNHNKCHENNLMAHFGAKMSECYYYYELLSHTWVCVVRIFAIGNPLWRQLSRAILIQHHFPNERLPLSFSCCTGQLCIRTKRLRVGEFKWDSWSFAELVRRRRKKRGILRMQIIASFKYLDGEKQQQASRISIEWFR